MHIQIAKRHLRLVILFVLLGLTYFSIETLWRGYSHWTMFLLGGLCGLLVGYVNELFEWSTPLWKQILIGEAIVLPLEFLTGVIVNIWLGWNVWDYSDLPLNILGQSSLLFALLFAPIIFFAILIDDYYRWLVMDEEKPRYKVF